MNIIRRLESNYNHPIGILADLQGPKQRVGVFASDTGVVRYTPVFILRYITFTNFHG